MELGQKCKIDHKLIRRKSWDGLTENRQWKIEKIDPIEAVFVGIRNIWDLNINHENHMSSARYHRVGLFAANKRGCFYSHLKD
jgi:hypothetical protein